MTLHFNVTHFLLVSVMCFLCRSFFQQRRLFLLCIPWFFLSQFLQSFLYCRMSLVSVRNNSSEIDTMVRTFCFAIVDALIRLFLLFSCLCVSVCVHKSDVENRNNKIFVRITRYQNERKPKQNEIECWKYF